MTALARLLLCLLPFGETPEPDALLPDVNKLRAEYKAAAGALEAATAKAEAAKRAYLDAVKAIADAAAADGIGKPTPPVDPVVTAKRVLLVLVEETGEAVATRGAMFADRKLADRIKAKATLWKVVDKDVVDASGKPPADMVPYLNLAAGKKLPILFLLDLDTRKLVYQGDAPMTAPAMLALLEKWNP